MITQACKTLVVFHQNIRGLQTSIESLEITLGELNPDIIVLSEHKMIQSTLERLKISNYKINSSFTRKKSRGGGALIMSKTQINFKNIIIPEIEQLYCETIFECCMAEYKNILPFKNSKLLLVGFYRNPIKHNETESVEKLNKMLEILTKRYANIVVMGDINIDLMEDSRSARNLNNVLVANGMRYLVDFPTRITESSESCIDNVFTNINKKYVNVLGVNTQLSDHDGQLLNITCKSKKLKEKKPNVKLEFSRKFSERNIECFLKALELESWFDVFMAESYCKYDIFHEIIMYYFNLYFPKKLTRKFTNMKPWVTDELKLERNKIIEFSQLARETKNKAYYIQLRKMNKLFRRKIYEQKKNHFTKKLNLSSNVNKTVWQIVNNEIGNKTAEYDNIKININDSTLKDPFSVCESFNDYFTNIVDNTILPKLLNKVISDQHCPRVDKNSIEFRRLFRCKPVDEGDIINIIGSLKNKKSSGYDEIPLDLIKKAKKQLVKPLTHVINASFVTGIFPSKLKIAKLKPFFKKGDKAKIENYRPVSLLPTISKIFERAMSDQLVDYLETNNLIHNCQHGFRKGKSVVTAATELIESVIDSLDTGKKIVGVFLDLSKAFDSISHPVLLDKLGKLGIEGKSFDWLKSYITNRKQFVELTHIDGKNFVNHYKSSVLDIKHGVPQGSILGPILFVCYLNDFPKLCCSSKTCLYADDTSISINAPSWNEIEIKLNNNLINLSQYFNNNNLLLNFEKSNCLAFCTKNSKNKSLQKFCTGEFEISQEEEINFLGLKVDGNLTWEPHVQKVMSKISSGIYALSKIRHLCDLNTLKMVYFSYIHSTISFGISLYGATNKKNLDSILKIQKKAIRIMLNLKPQSSVKEYFSELKILTIYSLYVQEVIMSVRCRISEQVLNGANHSYNTRNRNELAVPPHHLALFCKKPQFAGIRFYNKLPECIKTENSTDQFKKKLKQFLINKALYSFEEF